MDCVLKTLDDGIIYLGLGRFFGIGGVVSSVYCATVKASVARNGGVDLGPSSWSMVVS